MSVNLVLRPASSDIACADGVVEWQWVELDRKGQSGISSSCGARPPASNSALLLIPANWLHARQLLLPAMRRAQLRQAIPFALEEHVAGDIEQLHVAHGQPAADGRITAVAIDRYVLESLLKQLAGLDIRVIRALPDACCQPAGSDQLQVVELGDDYLVSSANDFLLLVAEELEFLLDSQVSEAADNATLVWYGRDRPTLTWPGVLRTHLNADPFVALAQRAEQTALNILQDQYAAAAGQSSVRGWRIAASLAVAVVIMGMAYAVTDWWLLKRSVTRYQQQVQSVFRETFPAISNVVNPRVQAERAMADINPASNDALLRLLGSSAPVLSAQQGVILHSVNYDRSGLRLDVAANSIAELDELEKALQAQGLPAQLDSAVRSGDSARAQIVINGGGS